MTFSFCRVCRLNHNHGKGHKYQKKHKVSLEKTLAKQELTVAQYKQLATSNLNIPPSSDTSTLCWCMFCDSEVKNVATPLPCYGIIHHLASKDHKKHVIDFLKEMGAPNNSDRTKYLIQRGEFNQFVHKSKNGGSGGDNTPVGPTSPNGNISNISTTTETTILNNPSLSRTEDTDNTGEIAAAVQMQERPRTVISKHGVKQNPTGFTEDGERVWGGGIVKYKKGEWIPWEIDLDDENNTFSGASLMGGVAPVVMPARTPTPSVGTTSALNSTLLAPGKMTEFAFAENLTRIEQKPLADGQGNVHSGAAPPWMVDELGAAIPTVPNTLTLVERQRFANKNKKGKNPRKLGANIDRSNTTYSDNWVPSFGRVFNEGPRSETRNEYKEEMAKNRKFQAAVSSAQSQTPVVNVKEKLITRQQLQQQLQLLRRKALQP